MTGPTTPNTAGGWREHERIFLEPPSESYDSDGRQWCQDNVWPEDDKDAQSVEFIRADLHAAAIKAARREGWCAGRDAAADVAGWAHIILDDGSGATYAEDEVSEEAERRIRALTPPETAP